MRRIFLMALCLIVLSGGTIIVVQRQHHFSSALPRIEKSYIALGDSVAAGDGLETYIDASACDRTAQAYPELVARAEHLKLSSLACSGATTTAGILGPQEVNGLMVPSQLSQLFSLPKPQLITITIGANDMQWTNVLSKCYTIGCGSAADTATVNMRLNNLQGNLTNILTSLKSHYGLNLPDIIVSGYYQIVPATLLHCPDMARITVAELSWERTQEADLNTTISSAVTAYAFAHFAPVSFSGHELCTPSSWVQDLDASAPFHPTDSGQQVYAKAVE